MRQSGSADDGPWARPCHRLPSQWQCARFSVRLDRVRRARNRRMGPMAAEVILEFDGVTEKEYNAVNKELGVDYKTGQGNWPDGLVAHRSEAHTSELQSL